MKAYSTIPIAECGEKLVLPPPKLFAHFDPPPYMALGAHYNKDSPWAMREGILKSLTAAQKYLHSLRPGWKIMLFDVYRPRQVQAYMVEREFGIKAREAGYDPAKLTPDQRGELELRVYKYWAIPSDDPKTPPGHCTGAAMDITLADVAGHEVDMGSPIDEGAPPAAPFHFATAKDEAGQRAHANRLLLRNIMQAQDFRQHPDEWWHFSKGDQLWAWLEREDGKTDAKAIYGRADLLK